LEERDRRGRGREVDDDLAFVLVLGMEFAVDGGEGAED